MKYLVSKTVAIILVIVFMLGVSIIVSATNEYNVNTDYDLYGNEVIDICDLVCAEKQDKSDSFVLKLQCIILEVEGLPISDSEPTIRGGIYLPEVP